MSRAVAAGPRSAGGEHRETSQANSLYGALVNSVAVPGSHLAVEQVGDGPAVVLCHAGIADHRMWAHQVAALAGGHRVIVYDWRGVGASGPARGDFAHHEDLLALLDALDVEAAVLIGASMGGGYAVDVALAAPHRVAGLVLISPGISGYPWPASFAEASRAAIGDAVPAERLAAYRAGSASRVREEDVAAMATAQAAFTVAGPTRTPEQVQAPVWDLAVEMLSGIYAREWDEHPDLDREADPPAATRLEDVSAPTLVVDAALDVPEIRAVADLVVDRVPGAQRVEVPDAAHLAPVERPEQVNAAITAFLGELGW